MDVKRAQRTDVRYSLIECLSVEYVLCMKSWVKSQHHSKMGVVGNLKCRKQGLSQGGP